MKIKAVKFKFINESFLEDKIVTLFDTGILITSQMNTYGYTNPQQLLILPNIFLYCMGCTAQVLYCIALTSVADPRHFVTDPDPYL